MAVVRWALLVLLSGCAAGAGDRIRASDRVEVVVHLEPEDDVPVVGDQAQAWLRMDGTDSDNLEAGPLPMFEGTVPVDGLPAEIVVDVDLSRTRDVAVDSLHLGLVIHVDLDGDRTDCSPDQYNNFFFRPEEDGSLRSEYRIELNEAGDRCEPYPEGRF